MHQRVLPRESPLKHVNDIIYISFLFLGGTQSILASQNNLYHHVNIEKH